MILVFLHEKGGDISSHKDELENLAHTLSADLVTFNAPFPHPNKPGKFNWFNKIEQNNHKKVVKEEFLYSLQYIKEKLMQLNSPLSEIVLIGHSQGGGMAITVGLALNLQKVFSICGDLPYDLTYNKLSQTPIYWLEAENDTVISQERKDSYKILQKMGHDLHYKIVENCTHNEIGSAFSEIENIMRKINGPS